MPFFFPGFTHDPSLAPAAPDVPPASRYVRVLESPLAGFQYYRATDLWSLLSVDDRLELAREPRNRFDANAVRIGWRGNKLGYLPRAEADQIARWMDRGVRFAARIAGLSRVGCPRDRVRLAVDLVAQ